MDRDFKTMDSLSQIEVGYYGGLERWPINNPMKGGMDWSGNSHGSNMLTGWFVVDSVTYNNGVLTAIDLRFEQYSEGATPALHDKIHWSN